MELERGGAFEREVGKNIYARAVTNVAIFSVGGSMSATIRESRFWLDWLVPSRSVVMGVIDYDVRKASKTRFY